MRGRAFFDTNIFIYLYAENEHDKQTICKDIVNKADECITSTQILNEINNVLIKKWKMPVETVKTVQLDVRRISEVEYINENTIDKAIELHARYGFSYYDCLMLASALESNCQIIYTEDMSGGQIINDTLRIVNPFKEK
jgi:predicted nucleic acid-binding protein